ncbi:hypothetical protein EYF80_029359 [Liparis tanakae]|uniref:Uncharacterized protein n=1 Tax=Liparis tanakae TaxID=230148 RepID=A0A4Z2H4J0_9TELE|nr:hypothetical protein EYF80_029359 [Liparis tanakae]
METHLTGRVVKAAEESERQASTAFMAEKFDLSERQLHFTGGGGGEGLILYLLPPSVHPCFPLLWPQRNAPPTVLRPSVNPSLNLSTYQSDRQQQRRRGLVYFLRVNDRRLLPLSSARRFYPDGNIPHIFSLLLERHREADTGRVLDRMAIGGIAESRGAENGAATRGQLGLMRSSTARSPGSLQKYPPPCSSQKSASCRRCSSSAHCSHRGRSVASYRSSAPQMTKA